MFRHDEHVLAQWDDGRWYPARINTVRGAHYTVVFDDGDIGSYDASRIASLEWGPGTRIECNWEGGGRYYPGVIEERDHCVVRIEYDDGDTEETSIGRCRSIEPSELPRSGEW